MTQYTYDTKGRLKCEAVRMNPANLASYPPSCTLNPTGSAPPDRITQYHYDYADRVLRKEVGVGTSDVADELTLTYSANDQLETLTDGEVNKTSFAYDGHDRLWKTFFPVTTKGANASSTTDYEQLTYDAGSNVTDLRLRDGNSFTFTYDNLTRVITRGAPSPDPTVNYSYDLLDRLTQAAKYGYTVNFGYDALSRQTSDGESWGTITRQFDLAGRLTRTTWPDSFYVDYDYLSTGELHKIRENGATSGAGVLATFGYDGLGRRTSLTRGNGAVTSYTYNNRGLLDTLAHDFPGTTSDVSTTFTYNLAGQISEAVRNNNNYAYTGTTTGSTATFTDGLNRLSTVGGTSAGYDTLGNLTTDPATGKSYGYWADGKLRYVTSPWTVVQYDPVGRLVDYEASTTTRFLSDGAQVAAEVSPSSGAVQKRFVYGPGIDEPIVEYAGSGTSSRSWLHADERGSVIALSDGSGTIAQVNRYDEYGRQQSTNAGRFQYTGQMWLPEAGVYHYRNRQYQPGLGRFLQTDPIGYAGGPNLYAYVLNDPVNLVDPLGLARCPAGQVRVRNGGYSIGGNDSTEIVIGVNLGGCEDLSSLPQAQASGNPELGDYSGEETAQERVARLVATERKRVQDNAYCGNLRAKAAAKSLGFGIGGTLAAGAIDAKNRSARGKLNEVGRGVATKGTVIIMLANLWWEVYTATSGSPRCGQGILD